jgi:small subunit ribosomal protein S24e
LDVKILDERPNPLMRRKEYTFEVDHAGAATPPRNEVRKELAKLVQVPADRLIIERMNARFGTAKTRGEAMAYATKEAVDVTVREHILIRNGLREKAVPAAPTPAGETPAPAAPKEQPKEVPPKAEPEKEEAPKEHAKPEHPKPEHPKAEHAKAEEHKPEAPKESHKGEGHKGDKGEHAEKGEKPGKAAKHEGKPKPAAEPAKEG